VKRIQCCGAASFRPFPLAYIVQIQKFIHFDAAPGPARKIMRLLEAPAPKILSVLLKNNPRQIGKHVFSFIHTVLRNMHTLHTYILSHF
jgi:hypothetical protein